MSMTIAQYALESNPAVKQAMFYMLDEEDKVTVQAQNAAVAVLDATAVLDSHSGDAQLQGGILEDIEKFEINNQELLDELSDDTEIDLPKVPESPVEKLTVLKQIDAMLRQAINCEPLENASPDKPTFGKFNGLITFLPVKDKPGIWIDVDGVNIDDGTRVQVTPYIQKKIDETKKRKSDEWLAKKKAGVEPYLQYTITREEYAQEMTKEYPVLPLPPQPGPKWNDNILYGTTGKLIRKASEYCEAHPAGMLVDLLVSLGSIIGRGPYFNIGATKHFTNEFMARVGDSSVSRKGTGRDAIDEVLRLVDGDWYLNRIESGFGSGEAIINRVRDASVELKMDHKTKKFVETIVPGVTDKRLCIREGEIASIFVLAGKADSRADITFRDGWDSKPLRNVVKGRTKDGFSNSAKCEEPHLSISGDTTISELRQKMPAGAENNGFGNRFIYVYVHRVKHCPHGGPAIDWTNEIVEFNEIVRAARKVTHVSMSQSARKWWSENYSKLENSGVENLAGKMTSRAPAHIRRIAMLYALLDLKDEVCTEHFQAAKRLWDYCAESALYIFSGSTAEQLHILDWFDLRGAQATYKQVRDELYHRNKPVGEIKADLAELVMKNKLSLSGEIYSKT